MEFEKKKKNKKKEKKERKGRKKVLQHIHTLTQIVHEHEWKVSAWTAFFPLVVFWVSWSMR